MSDNPLADWLRERGAWSGDGEQGVVGPSTTLGGAPPPPHDRDAVGPDPTSSESPGRSQDPGDRGPVPLDDPAPLGWADEPGPQRDRPRRVLLLLVLAALPWLGFAAVALGVLGDAGPRRGSDETAQQEGTDPEPAETGVAEPDVPADPSPGQATTGPEVDPPPPARAADSPGRADAERRAGATAALALRTELTGEAAEGGPLRYVDLAVAESVRWVEDVAIVEVAAVLLESAGDAWGEGRPARFAVPVRVTGTETVPVAAPWPVAAPAAAETPSWEPVADEHLAEAVASALTGGGYRRVTDVALARSGDVPGVLAADVVAVGPGATDPGPHRVWLRDDDAPSLFTADPVTREERAP